MDSNKEIDKEKELTDEIFDDKEKFDENVKKLNIPTSKQAKN